MARKQIQIDLHLDELVFDIMNKTYVVGRSLDNGDNPEQVAAIQAGDEPESRSQILRSIGSAFSAIRLKLGEYIGSDQTSGDNILFDGSSDLLPVVLNLPTNFNEVSIDAVASAMHSCIVNTAIAGWFSLTNPEATEKYMTLADNNIRQMMEAIRSRKRPERPYPTQET